MANRSALTASWWVEDALHRHGWPRVPYPFLAQLLTHVGDNAVEHYDCAVDVAGEYDDEDREGQNRRGAPDSAAVVVLFTATHLFVQTVDCHRRSKRFVSDVQVLRRSALESISSADDVEVHLPWLRRLRDWLAGWNLWLASSVEACVDRWPWLGRWYDVDEPDGDVVVDLTYRDLRDEVLTLPLGDDASSAQRLTQFLPALSADLS